MSLIRDQEKVAIENAGIVQGVKEYDCATCV